MLSERSSKFSIDRFSAPTVAQLMVQTQAVSPDTPVAEVLELLHRQSALNVLPITDESGRYLGALSRRQFVGFMTKPFVQDVFSRKTLSLLLQQNPKLAGAPMTLAPGLRVDQAMRELLNNDPKLPHEALPVLEGELLVGIMSITDMMLSLSDSQEKLIDNIKTLSNRLQEEVAQAAFLQRNLLPPAEFHLPGVKGVATLLTSTEVGGDYYDYYCVDNRWVVLMIGDVSGHGVASGTLVSAIKASAASLSASGERSPTAILRSLNDTLIKLANKRLLMTFFVSCLDTQSGDLTYANAGHPFPYLYRYMSSEVEMLEAGGMPLGRADTVDYPVMATQLDVGDRLFFCSDGLIEEENDDAEPFGYDRLEALLLSHFHESPGTLRDRILDALRGHSGKPRYTDDVTVICVEHDERQAAAPRQEPKGELAELGLVRIAESFYRSNVTPLIPRISRQNLVFLAEGPFADLIPRLSVDGVRRVLPRHQSTVQKLGWQKLLGQHLESNPSDLDAFLPAIEAEQRFGLTHSDDKASVIDGIEQWLAAHRPDAGERIEAVLLMADEALENGLYAAPRTGKGQALYDKGSSRHIGQEESLSLRIAVQRELLTLQVTDSWGTLTPAVFLNRLARHSRGDGWIPGVGGGGLFLLWRLSDYLQLRVHPHHQTQVTLLMDLSVPLDPSADKGFQFLYHSEIHESLSNEPLITADHARLAR